MTPFKYDGAAYRAQWYPPEIVTFMAMVRAVIDKIQNCSSDDAARRKLFPPLSKDAQVNKEFSRLIADQLADNKEQALMQFGMNLVTNLPGEQPENPGGKKPVEVVIPAGEVQTALQALTAIRLYLGERLGIETDEDSELIFHFLEQLEQSGGLTGQSTAAEQHRAFLASIFITAGWVSESLIAALRGGVAVGDSL